MANWYCSVNGRQYGPVGEEQVKAWLREARIGPNTLVWTEGMAGWQALSATPLWQGIAGPPTAMPPTPPVSPAPSGGRGKAIAGMVLGIWSLVFFCAWPLTLVTAIIGLVLSAGEMQRARHAQAKASGMATAGLVCSIIALAIGLATVAVILFASLNGQRHHFFFTTSRPFHYHNW